jgi:hypothetical protein
MNGDDEPDPVGPVADVTDGTVSPYDYITPLFAFIRTDGHYLHYVDELFGRFVAGNTYDVGMRYYDYTDLGAPTVGHSVRLDYQSLTGMTFYAYTGQKNQWAEISVYQRTFSDIQAEVWVFNFGAGVWDWVIERWVPDPDADRLGVAKIEAADARGADLTFGYNCPYDGMNLILVQDIGGQAGVLDLFDIEVSIPPPPSNDTCTAAEAITLSGGSASISGDSRSATDTVTKKVCTGYIFDAGPEVFYSLTLNAGDTVDITLDGIDFNESLYLFTDCNDVAGTIVASSNESSPEEITYEVPAGAGGTYYIGVDACGGGGSFTLDIVVTGP